jgi:hypothetical protein
MRKIPALLAVAVVAVAVAVAPATAQTPETKFTFKGKVSPKKAGTKAHPQGVKLSGKIAFETITPGVEPPIITGADILLPKTGQWNGGKYKTCSKAALNRKGLKGCSSKSVMGHATGSASADTVDASPTIDFVNGGKGTLWAYTTLYRPALVKEPVALKIKKLSGSKWGYSVKFRVPETLQIVAGVPITLNWLKFGIGGKSYAPKLITTTGCKGGKHTFNATTHYLYQDNTTASKEITSSVACTK